MKVAFFMPGAARAIRGGFKVLFKYASCLAEQGHDVTVFFPASNAENRARGTFARFLRYLFGLVWPALYKPGTWAALSSSVRKRWIWRGRSRMTRDFQVSILADRAVAADMLGEDSGRDARAGKTLYLFQEYEYYMTGGDAIRHSIETAIRRSEAVVAVSTAAHDVVVRVKGGPAGVYLINNGVELDEFVRMEPEDAPRRTMLGFALREEPLKRTTDIISALEGLKEQGLLAGMKCWAYGAARAPALPDWIEYAHRPPTSELCKRLNHTAIFLVSSQYEGWGLPGAEAMACGAALITSRNGGCEAYARHEDNALLFAPGNLEELTEAIVRLIENPKLRERFAVEGYRTVQQLTWPQSCARFTSVLESLASRAPHRNDQLE
jgi:glycosyltransferase involved in cell wall biosynthesis